MEDPNEAGAAAAPIAETADTPPADSATEVPARNQKVRIANPPPGYPNFVGLKHAMRWAKQRRAVWVGDVLSLAPNFRKILGRSFRPGSCSDGDGYDQVRRPLTETEKRNLPLVRPPQRPRRHR